MSQRLWERRPRDDDFGTIRLGTGVQKLAIQLIPPDTKPVEDLDAAVRRRAAQVRPGARHGVRAAGRAWRCARSPGSS